MRQRSIEIFSLLAHFLLRFELLCVAYLTHQIHAVGNHDEDDAHVLGKGEEEVAEVLRLDDGILPVELLYALEPVEDACDGFAEEKLHVVECDGAAVHAGAHEDGDDGIAAETCLAGHQQGRLEGQ